MIELLVGFLITIASIAFGFSLGKHSSVTPPDVTKKINQIFKRVVPQSEVGPVERPTAQQNFYRDNPRVAQEDGIMSEQLDKLQ